MSGFKADVVSLNSNKFRPGNEAVFEIQIKSNIEMAKVDGFLDLVSNRTSINANAELVSGDKTSGLWRFNFNIPTYTSPGDYLFWINLEDKSGKNFRNEFFKVSVDRKNANVYPNSVLKTKESYDLLAQKAYNEIRNNWDPKSRKHIRIVYHISEYFPSDLKSRYSAEIEKSAGFFDSLLNTDEILNVYFYTEKDKQYLLNQGIWNEENLGIEWFDRWARGEAIDTPSAIAAWYLKVTGESSPSLNGGLALSSKANFEIMNHWADHLITHESFHSIQDYYFFSGKAASGGWTNDERDLYMMPVFREGSTDLISLTLATENFENYLTYFSEHLQEFTRVATNVGKLRTKQDVVDYMRSIEKRSSSPEARDAAYVMGKMFFEYLIAQYGLNRYKALLESQKQNVPLREAFKKSYGQEIDAAYSDAAQHILNGLQVYGY